MKKLLSLILVILLCFSLTACFGEDKQTTSDYTVDVSSESFSEATSSNITPILYKITDSKGNYLYLFGSIHIGEDSMYPLPDYVMDAFYESDSLGVEVNVTKYEKDTSFSVKMYMEYLYADGSKLTDHISSDLYDEITKIFKQNGYGYLTSSLLRYQPALWEQFISQFYYENNGIDMISGVDRHLISIAEKNDITIHDVEDPLEHLCMPAKFSEELQLYLLRAAVDNYNSEDKEDIESINRLLSLWCQGDEKELIDMLFEEEIEPGEEEIAEEYNNAMMTVRNEIMSDFIEDALERGEKVFVTVGTAHIIGEESVTEILRNKCYKIERVK